MRHSIHSQIIRVRSPSRPGTDTGVWLPIPVRRSPVHSGLSQVQAIAPGSRTNTHTFSDGRLRRFRKHRKSLVDYRYVDLPTHRLDWPNHQTSIGTSSGFGRRLVSSVLARGDRVIATARSLSKLQDSLRSSSSNNIEQCSNLRLLQLDVTAGSDAIKATVDEAVAIWGRVDVLVNNAGFGLLGLLEEGGYVSPPKRIYPANRTLILI